VILVLAGRGGNGGGGICAARHLANRATGVRLVLADRAGLGDVPQFQYDIFRSTPGIEVDADELRLLRADVIIDAVIGYSLRDAPRGRALDLISWANDAGAPILSLDVPSGVDATTGEAPGEFVRATATMTLALPKVGLLPERTGDLILADIGIPRAVFERLGVSYTSPFGDRFRVPLVPND
jgi:NAD(P)H-hydrate epimerase